MKVVLDTNTLVSGIFWKGTPHTVVRAWAESVFEVIISQDILEEYLAVLKRLDPKGDMAESWTVFISENATVVSGRYRLKLSRDPADDKFIVAAILGRADYIVSGDKDLLSLHDRSPVPILNPRKFLAVLRGSY